MCVDMNTLKRISLSWMISIVNPLHHHNHAGLRDFMLLMTHTYVVHLTVRSLLIQQQIGECMQCVYARMYMCYVNTCIYVCLYVCVSYMCVRVHVCMCIACACMSVCLCEYKVLDLNKYNLC